MGYHLSDKDKYLIEKAIKFKDRYTIYVDNDDVFLSDDVKQCKSLDEFGMDLIVQLLDYIGCSVDWV